MRTIDRDALTKRLIELCNINCPYTAKARNIMCGSCFMGLALEAVEDAPTIDPERKTGKWVGAIEYCKHLEETTGERYQPSGLAGMIYCNQCWRASDRRSNYCRECGSVMTEGGDTP